MKVKIDAPANEPVTVLITFESAEEEEQVRDAIEEMRAEGWEVKVETGEG